MGIFHSFDLRNFRRLVDFSFLVADAEPETVCNGRTLRGHFGEKLIVPPKRAGLRQAITEMAGILQGQPRGQRGR